MMFISKVFIKFSCAPPNFVRMRITIPITQFSSSSTSNSGNPTKTDPSDMSPSTSLRLNRCLPMLSRREADKAVASGRVKINNKVAKLGTKVVDGDVLQLDGQVVKWSHLKQSVLTPLSQGIDNSLNVYIKLWKAKGTTCTTDLTDSESIFKTTNILSKVTKHRLFSVGRLDKHTTGIILLTSDTRLMTNLLGASNRQEKVYEVKLHKDISEEHLDVLRTGVEITTETANGKVITAMTLPCVVKRIPTM